MFKQMLVLLVFCSFFSGFTHPSFAMRRANVDDLEFSYAQFRSKQIKQVDYSLEVTFQKGSEEYSAKEKIDVSLNFLTSPLSLDWSGKKPIASIAINGKILTDYAVKVGSIEIPARYLQDKNTIEIEFTNLFSKEGAGIQHIVDVEDKSEYIYTDFEPYQAHELFPCFDQPDLKAHFTLTVTAPKDWKVIGNELPVEETPSNDASNMRVTKFKQTPLLSTYLFFVGAGEFVEWKSQEGKIPLFLYSRKSLSKFVDSENIFTTIQKGLRFYNSYFDFEYPFSKFAIVFAPEFMWGGMENPGAIVFNERDIFKGAVPQSKRDNRDDTILHEMAHMWFGDLVTMRWWNDLWLNESFATYLATIAMDRAIGSKTAWQDFSHTKSWGYWQDQLVTTHPIETVVKNVRSAKGNIDGITYAKGGAALQQLHFFVGEESFQKGVQSYFKEHAFANAQRADLVNAIAKVSRKNLNPWTKSWLQTSGLNRVRAEWKCAEGKLRSLELVQEPSSSKTLSPHRTRIGFYKKEQEIFQLFKVLDVSYRGHREKIPVDEAFQCPDFVFPNIEDKDFALFAIDSASMANVEAVLTGGLPDANLRLLVWNTLNQMVRDGLLSPLKVLEISIEGLKTEDNDGALSILMGRHSPLRANFDSYLSIDDRVKVAPLLEKVLLDRALAAEKGSSKQMLFFDFYTNMAQSPEGLARLTRMLKENSPPAGITLDQDRRWTILINLAREGESSANDLIDAEEKRDLSDTGKRSAYAARIAFPSEEGKRKFWNDLKEHEKIPPSTLESAANEFHQPNYLKLTEKFVDDFFLRVKGIDWKKSDQLIEVYFDGIFPGHLCSKALLSRSTAELKLNKNLTDLARRAWREANDELARCVRVGRR